MLVGVFGPLVSPRFLGSLSYQSGVVVDIIFVVLRIDADEIQ